MNKAEERALEFYPMKDYNKEPNYIHSCDSKMLDEVYRDVFRIGYEAAEKDLALTWEDAKEIVRIADTMMDFDPNDRPEWMESDKAYYTEVLKQFKEAKK